MDTLKSEKVFKTSDLPLAAVLAMKFRIISLDKTNPKRVVFFFEKDEKLEKIVEKYQKGTLKVSPIEFYSYLKFLKGMVNS